MGQAAIADVLAARPLLRRLSMRGEKRILSWAAAVAAVASLALVAACPGGGVPGVPKVPGGDAGKVDPNACSGYASNDAGKKLKRFLQATVQLEKTVLDTENYLRDTCNMMGEKLGMAPSDGKTKETCAAVEAALKDHMQVGLKAEATLDVQVQPAVCEVNVDVAAKAAASCEANASADVKVTCEGSCSGTCNGTCDGECAGSAGTDGSGGACNGECKGNCSGECSGSCQGHADVNASAECRAEAEVKASAEAKCTPPDVKVEFAADAVLDKSKVEAAVASIEVGLGRILEVQARASGPLMAAFRTWAKSAEELKDAGKAFGKQALCVGGQLGAAVAAVARVKVSLDVQVNVSASVSGSASGGAGGEASGG